MTPPELPAFGHGTAGRGALNALLHDAGIAAGVDVRTAPGSRRAPDLARWRPAARLPGEDIAYRWERDLGGFGEPPPDGRHTRHSPTPGARLRDDGLIVHDDTTAAS